MNVLTVDCQSPHAAQDFTRSLHETGFAVLVNHPIAWTKVEKAYREWEAFFKLPEQEKLQYLPNPNDKDSSIAGYFPPSISEIAKGETLRDLKEMYQLYIPWGKYPSIISNNSRDLFYDMVFFGQQLLQWIEQYLPEQVQQKLVIPLSQSVSVDRTQLRTLYYPALTGNEPAGAIRAAAHEDINLITLLPSSNEAGLEAKDKKGNWHKVPVNPKAMIINVGDMLQEMTDFYYISTTHRVTNPTGEAAKRARMSMPMFLHARGMVPISTRYPTAENYLHERLIELGHRKAKM